MARRGCMMLIKLFKISKYDFKVLTALVVAVVMRAIDHWNKCDKRYSGSSG